MRCIQILFFLFYLTINAQQPQDGIKIAFLADVHLQDLYGTLQDHNYKGVINPKTGKPTLLRTMDSQLHSTRIFNENYFAFIAALNDIAERKIKFVALPGDYSDDGQPLHVRGLQRILAEYSKKYNIQFFITTGNHDPVGPFAQEAGKNDFLGDGGKRQPIFSKADMYTPDPKKELPVVVTRDIAKMGYLGVTDYLHDFGFFPKAEYKFWATPFSNYTSDNYKYSVAKEQAILEKRVYDVAPGYTVPDVSYVVEPVEGLWLMAIDGNVYVPKAKSNGNSADAKNYAGADLGYNNVLSHKAHLVAWAKQIAAEAKRLNKTLIAFSHYPMIEFNDDASPQIEALMGKGKWQLDRVPVEEVARTFADAGIKIHLGGHMHINDTGIRTTKKGNTLVNIQTPSLAAYIPAYKLLTIKPNNNIDVQTITIDNVPGFDELFPLYKIEYDYLKSQGTKNIWNKDILETKSYHEFTDFHLKELVRLRFLPDDWPADFADFLLDISGDKLLLLSNTDSKKIKSLLSKYKLTPKDFEKWNGIDIVTDFYRIRSADQLAIADVGAKRIKQYQLLIDCFLLDKKQHTDANHKNLILFFTILDKFLKGAPANHFTIDLNTGKVKDLSN
jgi:3',5'-cyclic AMP phosphodiesterase CpdA